MIVGLSKLQINELEHPGRALNIEAFGIIGSATIVAIFIALVWLICFYAQHKRPVTGSLILLLAIYGSSQLNENLLKLGSKAVVGFDDIYQARTIKIREVTHVKSSDNYLVETVNHKTYSVDKENAEIKTGNDNKGELTYFVRRPNVTKHQEELYKGRLDAEDSEPIMSVCTKREMEGSGKHELMVGKDDSNNRNKKRI